MTADGQNKIETQPDVTPANSVKPPLQQGLWRSYMLIFLPMLLSNILQAASGTLNGVFVGRMMGVDALAAMSAFAPVFFLFLGLIIGLGAGATVLIGQAWGARDMVKLHGIAGSAVAMVLVVSLSVAVLGGFFASHLMALLGTPSAILEVSSHYARIMMLGTPVIFMLWLMSNMSRGVGDAVSPLWALVIATAVAMVLTPLFIKGWLGFPQLGVMSAAVSTVIANAIALLWLIWFWHRRRHPMAFTRQFLALIRFNATYCKTILRVGLPTAMQMLTIAIAELVLLGLVNGHGTEATAAYGAIVQTLGWVQFPAISIGITASILAAQAVGAGRNGQVHKIVMAGLQLNLLVTGATVGLAYLLAGMITSAFITEQAVADLAAHLLYIVLWTIVLFGMSSVFMSAMRASGAIYAPTVLTMSAILLVEIPAAYFFNIWIGIDGIWWAYALTFSTILCLQSGYYYLVFSKRKIVKLI
ncbi:MATE family efflux transporter [Pseudochrobactrum sp. MP213Fo]|uniref:MATE family efflux transporter n=1 Tax=Pseudochrobactrum sp. MP213Fo TaxID=3022250 RepID=UPI003BA34423